MGSYSVLYWSLVGALLICIQGLSLLNCTFVDSKDLALIISTPIVHSGRAIAVCLVNMGWMDGWMDTT